MHMSAAIAECLEGIHLMKQESLEIPGYEVHLYQSLQVMYAHSKKWIDAVLYGKLALQSALITNTPDHPYIQSLREEIAAQSKM